MPYRRLRALLQFYMRYYAAAGGIVTLTCCWLYHCYPAAGMLAALFFLKAFTLCATGFYNVAAHGRQHYFYYNLHLRLGLLLGFAAVADVAVFFAGLGAVILL